MTGLPEQAKDMLLKRIEDEVKYEAGTMIQRVTEQAQEEAKDKSRQIILQAIQRYAAEQTSDHTVSTVTIPSDDMKGRVIGREGRNIRSFEKTTGVDVIIDDTPGVVVVSCFDRPPRAARPPLSSSLGRASTRRIGVVTATSKGNGGGSAHQQGGWCRRRAPSVKPDRPDAGPPGVSHELRAERAAALDGVAYLARAIADELGLDGNIARRAGLFHDIGKAMDHEVEGSHPQIGMEFLRRFNEPEAVLNAALAHHGDVPATTPYTPIVTAADAISGSRPGARRESLERYVKRLRELEELASTVLDFHQSEVAVAVAVEPMRAVTVSR
jgi:ribonuclease Y